MSGSGQGAPPHSAMRVDERSTRANDSESRHIWKIVGTPMCSVIFSSAATWSARSASKLGRMTTRPPLCSSGVARQLRPPVWNIGMKSSVESRVVSSIAR